MKQCDVRPDEEPSSTRICTGRVVVAVGNKKYSCPLKAGLMAVKDAELLPAPEAEAIMLATFTVVRGLAAVQSALGPAQKKYPVEIVAGISARAGHSTPPPRITTSTSTAVTMA